MFGKDTMISEGVPCIAAAALWSEPYSSRMSLSGRPPIPFTYNACLFQGHGSVWSSHTGSFSTYRSGAIVPSTCPCFPRGCKSDLR